MKKWEKDYTTLKTKEQEDQEEVRVWKAINNDFWDVVFLLKIIVDDLPPTECSA